MRPISIELSCAACFLPPGALPMTALVSPEYTPLNPPEAANPALDWSLVLSVSKGKRAVSMAVPAMAPAFLSEKGYSGAILEYWFLLHSTVGMAATIAHQQLSDLLPYQHALEECALLGRRRDGQCRGRRREITHSFLRGIFFAENGVSMNWEVRKDR